MALPRGRRRHRRGRERTFLQNQQRADKRNLEEPKGSSQRAVHRFYGVALSVQCLWHLLAPTRSAQRDACAMKMEQEPPPSVWSTLYTHLVYMYKLVGVRRSPLLLGKGRPPLTPPL